MIIFGEDQITLDEVDSILFGAKKIEIADARLQKVEASYDFLKVFAENKVIYGVNTGFGPMAQYKVSDQDRNQLQYNLIRSHAAGSGKNISELYTKAAMIARLNTLLQGYSGVHVEVVKLLKELINRDINPTIPEHGGVGASGDLVQLAHLALNLIGEGEVLYKGEKVSTASVFKECGLTPIKMHIREGLSLINGTSVMSGIGLINLIYAKNLLNWSIAASGMINELVKTFDDHYSSELNNVKHHEGQKKVAQAMRFALNGSQLVRKRHECLYDKKIEATIFKDKVQEYYSLRCVPQILGPVFDTLFSAENILVNEINSVNDNPIVDKENNNVYHGGNFHGDYVALEMDKIKIAVTKLSMLCERQLNYLMNDKINNLLPPFVNLGKLGFNYGMQAAQFTATSTTAENQTLSFPMYIHSIPNNNDNQDIVSMGTNAANMTKTVIENSYQIISIELISILQAIDYLGIQDKLSEYNQKIYKDLRVIVPKFVEDKPLYGHLANMKNYLMNNRLNLIK